jgi:hypothetical protein
VLVKVNSLSFFTSMLIGPAKIFVTNGPTMEAQPIKNAVKSVSDVERLLLMPYTFERSQKVQKAPQTK